MVDTLLYHAVDQKWFSAFAQIGEAEEMVTTQEIHVVSWGSFFCISVITFNQRFMSSLPQATGNALISCIHAAHTNYELNLLDWQQVVEIGWHLLTKQDMERFEEMCEDGLLGPGDYVIFKDWSAIARSRDGYIRIRDRLVLEGEVCVCFWPPVMTRLL